jgi:hypothetical protein
MADIFRYAPDDLNRFAIGYDQQSKMQDQQAQRQAGNMLAQTADPAAAPLFRSGQLDAGAKVQDYTQDQHKAEIANRLGFLTKAATALSQIPDDGTQTARRAALSQHILPVLQQMGASPQDLQQLQSTDLSDQSLGMFQQAAKLQIEKLGNDLVGVNPTSGKASVLYHGEDDKTAKHDWKEVTNPDGSTSFIDLNAPQGGQPSAPAAAPSAPTSIASNQPRGVRNNNPLNVQPLAQGQWAGQTGTDGRYATFATPEQGMAAADRNLQTYGSKYGINTVAGVVSKWAPKGDGNNDPKSYAATVAAELGIAPNAPINLADPAVRQRLEQAMAKVELGQPAPGAPSASASGRIAGSAPGTKQMHTGDNAEEQGLSPEAVKLLAGKYLANGQLPPMGMGKAAAANRTAILNEATSQAKALGLDANDLIAGTASVKATGAALSKMTAMRSQISASENTVLKNADFALSLAPKGGGPTGIPVLNRWIQAGRKDVAGDADVAAFNSALGTVADEYAKVMTTNTGSGGGATSDSARQEAYRRLNGAMTQDQLHSVIGAMKTEMANRVDSLNEIESKLRNDLRSGAGGQAPPANPAPPAAGGWGKAVVVKH